jgi:hypothetical protein
MVRLVQNVARCTPTAAQRATNRLPAQPGAQLPAQRTSVSQRETGVLTAQPPAQQKRNGPATSGAYLNPQKLRATSAGHAELRQLIWRVLLDPLEREEALAAGLADIDAALLCYRALASDPPTGRSAAADSRRRCDQCRNLADDGLCHAAWRDQPLGFNAPRAYHPAADLLQHCAGFLPFPDDPDQRPGHERWPSLLREGQP